MKFSKNYEICNLDTDLNGVLSLSGAMRYFQDITFYHMESNPPSYEALFKNGFAFLLTRFTVSLYKPLYSHQKVTVETWATESKGFTFERCFRIICDKAICIEAVSASSLYNFREKKLVRVSDSPVDYGQEDMLDIGVEKRFHIPSEIDLSLVGEHTVRYRDIDMNRHMNNTVYGDMMSGFLPDMTGKRVCKFDISYKSEAPLGETLKIYSKESEDGTFYIRSVCNGKTNAEALIITEDI